MKAWIYCIAIATACLCPMSLAANDVFLLSYFKGNGETGVYLAASDDGLTFQDLNAGRPVFTPPQWAGQNLTRDPSIVYRDGLFHMVWTSSWTGECFGAATSPDLKHGPSRCRWSRSRTGPPTTGRSIPGRRRSIGTPCRRITRLSGPRRPLSSRATAATTRAGWRRTRPARSSPIRVTIARSSRGRRTFRASPMRRCSSRPASAKSMR